LQFGRYRHRWEGNMKIDIKEIGWEIVDWIHLSDNRGQRWADVSMIINFQVL
jgi:hypothetical protein